ncbi:MAG: hypothetical protein NTY30_00710 [Candidatus Berkelbacteria bacterium]|nr:hypothetical protein [Candidatus Berkelbacteria bacterium]
MKHQRKLIQKLLTFLTIVFLFGVFVFFSPPKAHAEANSLYINIKATLSDLPLATAGAEIFCKTDSGSFIDSGRTASAGVNGYCQVTYSPTSKYQVKLVKDGYKTYISSTFFLSQADYDKLSNGDISNSKSFDYPINVQLPKGSGTINDTTAIGSTTSQTAAVTASGIEPIYKVLTPDPKCKDVVSAATGTVKDASLCYGGMGAVTARIWYDIMAVCNSLVLAVLIWVAFMNILRIQMDSYAVKKFLPTFIMAIILANFSFLISRMLLDIANIAISAFLTGNQAHGVTGAFSGLIAEKPIGPVGFTGNYAGYILVYILKQIFVGVGAVLVAILAFIFLLRNYFIYFLICISPAAFMAMILPITKKYFQQWWSQFLKWIFMPVVSVFWLWLAGEFLGAIDPNAIWVLPMAFAGLCLYMAITSPFKVDKAVGQWAGLGKKAWGNTGGQAVKGAKWMGNGGYASWRAYSNQQKAVVAKSRSTSDNDIWAQRAKKFEGNADRWTKANPRALREGIKSRFATGAANAQKAPYKTPWYNTLAGRTAAIDAKYQSSFESDRNRTATDTGMEARKQLDKIKPQLNADYVNRMKLESRKTSRAREREILGFSDTEEGKDAYQKHLIMADFDDKGAAKLDVTHQGVSAGDLGDLKSIADAYRKNLRRRDNKQDALKGFITEAGALLPSSGVPGGAAPAPSGEVPTTGEPTGESKQVEVDNSRLEELIQQLIDKQGSNVNADKTIADASRPNLNGGVFNVPEINVRIKGIDPIASEQLRLLQTRVAKTTNLQAMRLAQKEDATLQAIAHILKTNQKPEQVEAFIGEAQAELDKGNIDGAQAIVEKYHPETTIANNLENKNG